MPLPRLGGELFVAQDGAGQRRDADAVEGGVHVLAHAGGVGGEEIAAEGEVEDARRRRVLTAEATGDIPIVEGRGADRKRPGRRGAREKSPWVRLLTGNGSCTIKGQ